MCSLHFLALQLQPMQYGSMEHSQMQALMVVKSETQRERISLYVQHPAPIIIMFVTTRVSFDPDISTGCG